MNYLKRCAIPVGIMMGVILIALVAVGIAGCERYEVDGVTIGDTAAEAKAVWGEPDDIDVTASWWGKTEEWTYYYQGPMGPGQIKRMVEVSYGSPNGEITRISTF